MKTAKTSAALTAEVVAHLKGAIYLLEKPYLVPGEVMEIASGVNAALSLLYGWIKELK